MDTNSLSFRYEEHFTVFEPNDFLNTESECFENTFETPNNENMWEWEVERELNGDVALIPMSSDVTMDYLSHSPPKEDFQKIMSDWQQFMNMEVPDMETLTADIPLTMDEGNVIPTNLPPDMLISEDCVTNPEPIDSKPIFKFPRSTGKKIDMQGQCYIVDDKKPTETEIEQTDSNVQQNEVKMKDEEIDITHTEVNLNYIKTEVGQELNTLTTELTNNYNDPENDFVDVDTISEYNEPILEAKDVNSLLEQFEATETVIYSKPKIENEQKAVKKLKPRMHIVNDSVPPKTTINSNSQSAPKANSQTDSEKNKQILNALPQELIMKIKASSKRKVVPVIEPIPKKRRGIKKLQPEVQSISPTPPEKREKVNAEFVQREHDYCSLSTPYPKYPQKDSGFESAEEEEQRSILRNQPTVKGADGKLMVSLLKVNTIRNSIAMNDKKKRKLNLEEYKKRREGFIRSCDNSQSNSPVTSGRSSPSQQEDDQTRLLKHQQKLMQMAAEVLKTPPKSARKVETPLQAEVPIKQDPIEKDSKVEAKTPLPIPNLPENIEVKTIVSIGVNTDQDPKILKYVSVPVLEIEEIKPILKNANGKISNNSLITSVIENIQNKKQKQCVTSSTSSTSVVENNKPLNQHLEHGEDKTIVYLDKSRSPVITNTIAVQTEIPEGIRKHRRRRNSRSSSDSHRKSYKWRSSSNDSTYSYSSQTSSSASSYRSRSPSPSPSVKVYNRRKAIPSEDERIREVEERRIVYVGGIPQNITKEALRRRFQKFGPIRNISIHFREYGDNYGFVTFAYKTDAYEAVEHGNDDPKLPPYDLSFGGRRIFCGTNYSDLDNVHDDLNQPLHIEDSFDNLLREVEAKLQKRKSCQ